MATIAYPDAPAHLTTVAPFRRPRVREAESGDPIIRHDTVNPLTRVSVEHQYITQAEIETLNTWLATIGDDDDVSIVALDGRTYRGQFVDRLYSIRRQRGRLFRASIQIVGRPQAAAPTQ